MKKTLLILFSIFFTGHLFAKCDFSGLSTFPANGTIKQNSWIILEGYAESQKIINSLNQDYPIYLEAKGHKVKLNVKDVFKGMFRVTQAILIPEENLIPGNIYYLKIDKLKKSQRSLLTIWNSENNESEPIAWKVKSGIDISIPVFNSVPKLIDNTKTHYGCGPEIHADFKFEATDDSELLIKTEFVNIKSGETNIYHLNISEINILSVGHEMCSGAFEFEENEKYKVRFNLMDICGNGNNEWTDWIEFESPFREHKLIRSDG